MREVIPAACWQVYRYDFARWREGRPAELGSYPPDLESWAGAYGERDGQRFLIGPDGRPDERVNAFLASPKMRNRAENTNRDYAYSLGVWLNFLLTTGRNWWGAADDEVEAFQFWRLTDPRNAQPVEASSFARDVAACKSFYRWIGKRHAVVNPFEDYEPPRSRKGADVKWLDPAAVTRWVDIGLRGRDLSGTSAPSWQGRNEQRDAAFAEGLYGTGLRLGSWASVVLPELPGLARGRGFFRCQLADACAKGGNGYPYWMPLATLRGALGYAEGARAAAVRRAQAAGRYDRADSLLVAGTTRSAALLEAGQGGARQKAWNDLGPEDRLRLFRRTPQGLEPVALWLNEDGLPRDGHGWHHTFDTANARVASLGLDGFSCTPHMLRHSMALKWFAIGKLVHAARLGHLAPDEASDFRAQFGDTWHLAPGADDARSPAGGNNQTGLPGAVPDAGGGTAARPRRRLPGRPVHGRRLRGAFPGPHDPLADAG